MTTPFQQISPLRNTTTATAPKALAEEQLHHFGIDPTTEYGQALCRLAENLYQANAATHDLWKITFDTLGTLDRSDRIAYFNAKRFVCFQLAKVLDSLQNPMRRTYQSIMTDKPGFACKGPYPIFDNVTAIFSATPVITRTATYLFACMEWVEDAFKGREPLHEIYSRLLNPTSISLANHIVDIECGARASEYMAWNFNSGMAAIDGLFSHLLGARDIVLSSRNIYGGTYQLLEGWFGKASNLDIAIEWFDGFDAGVFETALVAVEEKYADRLKDGRRIYVFLESPSNPHGYVVDVPAISRIAHGRGWVVAVDTTVGTPFLHPVLRADKPTERPDFVIHSYTKDLSGSGTTTAGVVIGQAERMFLPKGDSVEIPGPTGAPETIDWDGTLFWNVYYIKGAFLDADKAFEVLAGMRTFESRVLQKAINTTVLVKILSQHPAINVNCPAAPGSDNAPLMERHMFLGLPAPLFTIDFEGNGTDGAISRAAFKRFYDNLEPAIGFQVSLGQTNTTALCPALTSHSELSQAALHEAGITTTTTRIAVGLEDPRLLIAHMQRAGAHSIEPDHPGFCDGFPPAAEIDRIYRETYIDVHSRFVEAQPGFEILMS